VRTAPGVAGVRTVAVFEAAKASSCWSPGSACCRSSTAMPSTPRNVRGSAHARKVRSLSTLPPQR